MNLLPNTSGIYKITCIPTKRIYIGSAINLRQREAQHFNALQYKVHHNPPLQNAYNKYGKEAFTFEVLELVLPISLTAREQYWLNALKPFGRRGFNIATEAGSALGVKHTIENREKIRQRQLGKKQSPEEIEKRIAPIRGRKKTPQHIENARQAKMGHETSLETREKLRQANLGKKRSLESIEKQRQTRLGGRHTPASIEKMRQSRLGKKLSPESIAKRTASRAGWKPTPEQVEKTRQARWGKNKPEGEQAS